MQSADHVVCISKYARKTVLRRAPLHPERVSTIYIGLADRLAQPAPAEVQSCLDRWQLAAEEYFLYPANSWPHKNHRRLFEAYARYLAEGGHAASKLVCTGADTGRHDRLRHWIDKLGLTGRVVLTGFVSNEELASLYVGCRALVFPSLYEGFGMPVAEALAYGKPVLCSNTTSLPEIAGGAALLFDPREPAEIAAAMRRLEQNPAQVMSMIERGRQHVAGFGTGESMARAYLDLFDSVAQRRTARPDAPPPAPSERPQAVALLR
ncbi:MAG: glycosyltransferase family 4 protein [Pirellulales bacterium]|nr:glycosyltransferase family 4 protein [Pirellulales bacterium]